MTAPAWTPGPWRVNPAAKTEIMADGDPMVICWTASPLFEKRSPANAALIAAAPDLYAACAEAEAVLLRICEGRGPPGECRNIARAVGDALARARGEQP